MISRYLRFFAFATLVICLAVFTAGSVFARDAVNVTKQKPADKVTLTLGKADVVAIGKDVADVLVSDPDIVEVGPIKNNQLYLIGSALGDTNVLVFDKAGGLLRQLSVHVKADTSKLEENLRELFPKENIKADAVGDQLVLTGTASSADVAARARDIAQRFAQANETVVNNISVMGGQQVMIHVKVVEVARNVLNELGIETDATGFSSGRFTGTAATADSFGLTVDPSFGTGSLIYSSNGTGPISLVMRALERDGLVNTLAQPNLTAISGENARFLAGGEFPIPSERDNNGNIVYEYRPFGVSLSFRPIVLDKDRINLQISTEVSEVSTELTLELPGVTVPSFSVRRAETTVEMASGGSLMIAGLIESQALERMNALPGINEVPILGALARSESFTRNESELLVMITAYLVEPFAEKEADRIIDASAQTGPLNRALAESMAIAYGESISSFADGRPFGFIME